MDADIPFSSFTNAQAYNADLMYCFASDDIISHFRLFFEIPRIILSLPKVIMVELNVAKFS